MLRTCRGAGSQPPAGKPAWRTQDISREACLQVLCSECALGMGRWALEQGDCGGLAESGFSGAVVIMRTTLDRTGVPERVEEEEPPL